MFDPVFVKEVDDSGCEGSCVCGDDFDESGFHFAVASGAEAEAVPEVVVAAAVGPRDDAVAVEEFVAVFPAEEAGPCQAFGGFLTSDSFFPFHTRGLTLAMAGKKQSKQKVTDKKFVSQALARAKSKEPPDPAQLVADVTKLVKIAKSLQKEKKQLLKKAQQARAAFLKEGPGPEFLVAFTTLLTGFGLTPPASPTKDPAGEDGTPRATEDPHSETVDVTEQDQTQQPEVEPTLSESITV